MYSIWFFFLVLACTKSASASILSPGKQETRITPNNGSFGNLTWSVNDGVLTINGTGEMDTSSLPGIPWNGFKDSIYVIEISEGVTSIGTFAFFGLHLVESIKIPDSVESIERRAFYKCYNLSNVILGRNLKIIDEGVFLDCISLTSIVIPEKVKKIESNSFYNCASLKEFTIGPSVESIGSGAFGLCPNLLSIKVEERNMNFKIIDGVLFNRNLTSIVLYPPANSASFYIIPDGVTSIKSGAFVECNSLINLTIPDSVQSIESKAFVSCTNLLSVFYQGSTKQTGDAFNDTNNLKTICVPTDYPGAKFCKMNTSSSTICQEFQGMFTRCSKPVFANGSLGYQLRSNAKQWEEQSNQCVGYKCDDIHGEVQWSLCNNSVDKPAICVAGQCVRDDSPVNDKASTQIVLNEPVDITALDTKDIVETLRIEYKIDDEITFGWECNEYGKIVRVTLYVDDKETAEQIANVVQICSGI